MRAGRGAARREKGKEGGGTIDKLEKVKEEFGDG